ncbi:MAG TPA: hypothetical protein VH107_18375 [Lacipirellulaceae bacterium]|nr:hypothetical protein [Lacipirellulaceae bacterium]
MPADLSTAVATTSPQLASDRPPLRIHHFLLCGIVCAIYLTWWRTMVPPSAVEQLPPWAIGFTAVFNALEAVGFTLAALSVFWRFKGYAGLEQPGVWLLLSFLVAVIPTVINNLLITLIGFDWPGALRGYYGTDYWALTNAWYLILFRLTPLVFFAYGAWAVADTRAWRWVFVVIAMLSVFPIVAWISQALSMNLNVPIKSAIAMPSFIAAAAIFAVATWALTTDITQQRRRCWPHWAGIGLLITQQFLLSLGALITLVSG